MTMFMPLLGHTSPESAYIVEDYPYGFSLRTKVRMWIETADKGSKKGFMRFAKQTLNPKNNTWNKPHYSTYAPLYMLVKDVENEHIHGVSLLYKRDIEGFKNNITPWTESCEKLVQEAIPYMY